MTIDVRGFAPNIHSHIVRLALHLLGLPRIIEMIPNLQQNHYMASGS